MDYRQHRRGELILSVGEREGNAIIDVIDTGAGIAPENVQKSSKPIIRPRRPELVWDLQCPSESSTSTG